MADESPFEVEEWLADWLEKNADLVAAQGADKVFPIFVPQSELLPATTFRRRGTRRGMTSRGADGEATPTFELGCEAVSDKGGYQVACRAARAIRLAINGFQGAKDGHNVRRVSVEDEYDDDNPPVYGDGVVTHRRVLVVVITHTEIVRKLIGTGGI